jgi:hypothetical protein
MNRYSYEGICFLRSPTLASPSSEATEEKTSSCALQNVAGHGEPAGQVQQKERQKEYKRRSRRLPAGSRRSG